MPEPAAAAHRYGDDSLQALLAGASRQVPRTPRTSRFRFGDRLLEVVCDHEPLMRQLDAFYGDCADLAMNPSATCIRCTATELSGGQFLSLKFDASDAPDLLDIALGLHRFQRRPPYADAPGPLPGWRLLMHAEPPRELLVASDGRTAVINLPQAPPEFLLDCISGMAQALQTGVMFLHAASVGVAGSGAILLGPSKAGKSTNALTLAMRGHAFLGDDVAAIRTATLDLLPMPKSAGLRDGPLAQMLERRLQTCSHVRAPSRDGEIRTVVRVGELFPAAKSGPLPLRYAFLLEGRRGTAKVTPFIPGTSDLLRLRGMVIIDTSPSWGKSAGRDLMQLLAVVDLLSRLRCFLVELGSTEETASAIERAMRD